MDLKIFFDSIDNSLFSDITDPSAIYHSITSYYTKFPDWKNAKIAIIGNSEDRGSLASLDVAKGATEIRTKLYRHKGKWNFPIVDLGNIRSGLKLEDSYLRIKEVCEVLMQNNVMPIIIGGTHDLDFGQYLSYESSEKLINVLNVDAVLDMQGHNQNGSNTHHSHQILVHEPNYLFHFCNLGYQTYLNDAEMIAVLEKLYFENYRLGQLRENFQELEPVIRHADMMTFDINAIKMQDCPGSNNARPFGLTAEEACQICWYAGLSNRMSSVGFYEYIPSLDTNGQTAFVIATMIWYIIEGFANRRKEPDFTNEQHYTKFVVSLSNETYQIAFYKSRATEKWWMEVPYPQDSERANEFAIIPCSYNDYLTSNKGEIPTRWINMNAKLI